MELATLVEKAREGDAIAFGQVVARYRGLVFAICLSEAKQPDEAEDLTQEVFVRAYHDLSALREPEKLLPWLRQVARNVCRMWLRRRRVAAAPLEAISEKNDLAAAARLKRVELGEIVSGMLAQVSPRSREVLALRYLGDCSEAEIAAALGISLTTVKSRLHEARAQAKRKLLPVVKELLSLQTPSKEMVERVMARCGSPGCVCPDTLVEGR